MAKPRPHTRARTIDERFDEVTQAFVEQRDFTLFCFDKLQESTNAEFTSVRAEISSVRAEISSVRAELKAVEGRLNRRLDVHEVLLTEVLREVKALRPA